MIEETCLPDDVMAELACIVPGPEPPLEVQLPRIPVIEEALARRIIPVSDPRLVGNELRYLTQCIQSNWISSAGRFVREFEEAFARMMGCEYGVACSNGTTSLHLALVTFGLQPGDEVILPTFTMIATANAVRYTGATPVLVDAERDTWNPDTAQIEKAITPRTKGIIIVHTIFGMPILTLLFRNFYAALPAELFKAARVDGAGFWGVFFRIMLPMSVPITVVAVILQVTGIWNDFLFGVVFAGRPNWPMTVQLNNIVNTTTGVREYNVNMAATILTAAVPLLIYFISGRWFVRGIAAGAVKG